MAFAVPGVTGKLLPTIWLLPDELWARVEPVLLRRYPLAKTGRPRTDLRRVLDGIIYRLRSGVQWNQLPREFGDDSTVHRWFQRFVADTDPNFSPDGKTISFVRIKQDGKLQALFAVRRDGSGLHQLTPYEWEVAIKHDWSPDGKLIVLTTNADFVRPGESANLVTIHPDGTGKKELTRFTGGKQNAFAGSFSPDGEQIVFRLESGDTYSLAVVDRDGNNLDRLTTGKDKPRFIDWGTHP